MKPVCHTAYRMLWSVLFSLSFCFSDAQSRRPRPFLFPPRQISTLSPLNLPVYKNNIKLSALRLVDGWNPGLELGYERQHGLRYASQFTATLIKDFFGISELKGAKGFRFSFEEKRFLSQIHKNRRSYIAAELAYRNGKHAKVLSNDGNDDENTYEQVTIHKKTYSFNFKGGFQLASNHFVLDFSAGAGLKYKDVSHSPKNDNDTDPYSDIPLGKTNYEPDIIGKYFSVNVPMSVKLGYSF